MRRPYELPALQPAILLDVVTPEHDELQSQVDLAVEQGRAEGYAAGLDEGRAQLASAISALEQAVDQLEQREEHYCDAVEPAVVELILAAVEQILGEALDLRPELIAPTVKLALLRIVDREEITLLVNPDDYEQVRALAEEEAAKLGGIKRLDVQTERRVGRGGVIAQTPNGDVDASIATRLERLREVVQDALAT